MISKTPKRGREMMHRMKVQYVIIVIVVCQRKNFEVYFLSQSVFKACIHTSKYHENDGIFRRGGG